MPEYLLFEHGTTIEFCLFEKIGVYRAWVQSETPEPIVFAIRKIKQNVLIIINQR